MKNVKRPHPLNKPWEPKLDWPEPSRGRSMAEFIGIIIVALIMFAFLWTLLAS